MYVKLKQFTKFSDSYFTGVFNVIFEILSNELFFKRIKLELEWCKNKNKAVKSRLVLIETKNNFTGIILKKLLIYTNVHKI